MKLYLREIEGDFARWAAPADVPEKPITSVSTDSRRIDAGALFIALKGENFDGHDFVQSALEQGAAAALVEEKWFNEHADAVGEKPLLVAPDTLGAFQEIARYYRQKLEPTVVAVTGSAGKTTCKEFLHAVLSQKYRVLRNEKSFNNHVGVPTTLLKLEPEHDILVTELGANDFGEIENLSRLVEPDVCILLNIGWAHLEKFKDRAGVARAKMEIFSHAAPDGHAVVNFDDDFLCGKTFPLEHTTTFAIYHSADVVAENIQCDHSACYSFDLFGERIQLSIPGQHNIYNALAAAAVGIQFDVPMAEIASALAAVNLVEHRMTVVQRRGVTVIDDAYNANPGSCRAALATLANMEIAPGNKRIAVLGDMLELGDASRSEHEKLAEAVKEQSIDRLFLFGEQTQATAARARDLSLHVQHFLERSELIEHLIKTIEAGDIVLIKGSRSMRMERIIEKLT